MGKRGVDVQIRKHFMGQTCDDYMSVLGDPEGLLRIYWENMPRLDEEDSVEEVVKFARSRGPSLDPKALTRIFAAK